MKSEAHRPANKSPWDIFIIEHASMMQTAYGSNEGDAMIKIDFRTYKNIINTECVIKRYLPPFFFYKKTLAKKFS